MPECVICGRKLGLKTPRAHIVQEGLDAWYCADHWSTLADIEVELVDVKNRLKELMIKLQNLETTLKELKARMERRR